MREHFFITGPPRSRIAWVANYLSYGNMLCLHDALRFCDVSARQARSLFGNTVEYCGISDPALPLMQDKFIEEFPDAKWVLIDRPHEEVERSCRNIGVSTDSLYILQTKLEELRGKLGTFALNVPFHSLNSSVHEIARFVNPSWVNPVARHEMLIRMNVQALPGNDPVKDNRHMIEPLTFAPSTQDYLNVLREMTMGDDYAFSILNDVIHIALVWDHVFDRDGLNVQLFNRVMTTLITEWPINPFMQKYGPYITPTFSSAINAWLCSYEPGAPKQWAYQVYAEVPAAVAFALGGNARVQAFMPRIRALVEVMCDEDNRRDLGKR